jgi:hypothetical protein
MSAQTVTPAETTPAETPKVETPKVVINLADAKLTDAIEAKPKYAELTAVGLAKLTEFAKQAVGISDKLKADTKTFNMNAKVLGKVVAAMKVRYAEATDSGILPKLSFAQYHKNVAKGPVPNHAESCSVTFMNLVLTDRITEDEYDLCATDWLEKAAAIVSKVLKDGKNLDCDEVKQVCDILKKRDADKAAKELRALAKQVKGEGASIEAKDGDKTTVVDYSPALLAAVLNRAFNENHHALIVGVLTDEISEISKRGRDVGAVRDFYTGLTYKVGNAWDVSGIPAETINAWESEWETAKAPLRIMAAGVPVETKTAVPAPETPAPETPATPDFAAWVRDNQYSDEMKAAIGVPQAELDQATLEAVTAIHAQLGRLPANIEELDALMNAVPETAAA